MFSLAGGRKSRLDYESEKALRVCMEGRRAAGVGDGGAECTHSLLQIRGPDVDWDEHAAGRGDYPGEQASSENRIENQCRFLGKFALDLEDQPRAERCRRFSVEAFHCVRSRFAWSLTSQAIEQRAGAPSLGNLECEVGPASAQGEKLDQVVEHSLTLGKGEEADPQLLAGDRDPLPLELANTGAKVRLGRFLLADREASAAAGSVGVGEIDLFSRGTKEAQSLALALDDSLSVVIQWHVALGA